MNGFFSSDFYGKPFELFSLLHIITLLILVVVSAVVLIMLKKFDNRCVNVRFRYIAALLLVLSELAYEIWSVIAGIWSVEIYLPFQLCDLTLILSAIMLINKNRFLYEITYFLGIGGGLQAIITPDLVPYSFPHFVYFTFFFTHGLTIIAVLYMTIVENYRPDLKSIWKTFVFTNIYMVFTALVNLITNGNYLFLCRKPEAASLMDVLGPWPWYVLELEVIGVIIFFILYFPFFLKDIIVGKNT